MSQARKKLERKERAAKRAAERVAAAQGSGSPTRGRRGSSDTAVSRTVYGGQSSVSPLEVVYQLAFVFSTGQLLRLSIIDLKKNAASSQPYDMVLITAMVLVFIFVQFFRSYRSLHVFDEYSRGPERHFIRHFRGFYRFAERLLRLAMGIVLILGFKSGMNEGLRDYGAQLGAGMAMLWDSWMAALSPHTGLPFTSQPPVASSCLAYGYALVLGGMLCIWLAWDTVLLLTWFACSSRDIPEEVSEHARKYFGVSAVDFEQACKQTTSNPVLRYFPPAALLVKLWWGLRSLRVLERLTGVLFCLLFIAYLATGGERIILAFSIAVLLLHCGLIVLRNGGIAKAFNSALDTFVHSIRALRDYFWPRREVTIGVFNPTGE